MFALLPQQALAADARAIPTVVTFGVVALAIAASLWALAANLAATRLRRSLAAAKARARAAIATRDAILDVSGEGLLVWGRDAKTARSYGAGDALLDSCLEGPEALLLSQALNDLSDTGAPFTLQARQSGGETVSVRGRVVGALTAVWIERKAAAAESGADLRMIADAVPVPVWLRDLSLAPGWVNRAYAEAVGRPDPAAVIAAQAPLETFERDMAASARAELRATEAKRCAVIGGQQPVIAMPETSSVLEMALDVTDLSNTEARFRQHAESQADTLDRLTTAVAVFDKEQRLSFHNRAFARLWDLPHDWLNSHPADRELLDRLRELRKLPEQRDYQVWKRERLAAYDRPDAFLPEEQWHLPSGQTLRVVTQPQPLGGLTYFYEDITEKLALERSYNTLIGVQRATLDTLGEGVAVFGLDGRLKLHNAAFAQLWRLDPAVELAGEPHLKDVVGLCIEHFGENPVWRMLLDSVSAGDERQHDWGEFERSDHMVLSVALAPLPDGATLVTFADVTDRSRAEAALHERNEALQAADELKSAFVQHASFLFRNPLNAVLGFADLLAGSHAGPLNAKQNDYVQSILAASQKLAEITSDILDLAMIESGDVRLELARVSLCDLLSRAAEPFRQHTASRDVTFVVDVAPDIGAALLDERRIRQVVFNLLSNAVRYTPRGGEITLGACIAGNDMQIYVADSGPGIAADVQPRAFERFQAKMRGGRRGGAGLGLALVNSFVALHDGWVEIETGEGRGTLVRCHLPRRTGKDPTSEHEHIHAA